MLSKNIKILPDELTRTVKQLSIASGCLLLKQDEFSNFIYLVKSGMVKAFHTNEKGQEFLLGIFGQDELFGELEFFTNTKNFASVKTISSCRLFEIPKTKFKSIIESDCDILKKVNITLAERLLRISQRTVENSYYPLEFVIAKYLVLKAVDGNCNTLELNKTETAEYFGTSIRSVNRILKKFCELNLITLNGSALIIKSLQGLKKTYYGMNI